MSVSILGVDLGTSGAKLLLWRDGVLQKVRAGYPEATPDGFACAVRTAAETLDLRDLSAVCVASQVGTYVIDGREVIGWRDGAGKEELERLLGEIPQETFLQEISMPHPRLVSYPLPRLSWIGKRFPAASRVCMPKDQLLLELTGRYVTDPYSWRGLCHLPDGVYSQALLDRIGFSKALLPEVLPPEAPAGAVTAEGARRFGLPEGTPVFTGCNDFFAGLLGMGLREGDVFDVTGTSEHIGVLTGGTADPDPVLVSGPFLHGVVSYGVTASSGTALNFSRSFCRTEELNESDLSEKLPVFLPYLNGERAPVWDPDARGVFFGIGEGMGRRELALSVLEGIVFSLYQIYQCLGAAAPKAIAVSGGAACVGILNRLKASMFGCGVIPRKENDTTALGAVMIAARGCGMFADYEAAAKALVQPLPAVEGDPALGDLMHRRFEIYSGIYPAVKPLYPDFRALGQKEEKD